MVWFTVILEIKHIFVLRYCNETYLLVNDRGRTYRIISAIREMSQSDRERKRQTQVNDAFAQVFLCLDCNLPSLSLGYHFNSQCFHISLSLCLYSRGSFLFQFHSSLLWLRLHYSVVKLPGAPSERLIKPFSTTV